MPPIIPLVTLGLDMTLHSLEGDLLEQSSLAGSTASAAIFMLPFIMMTLF